MTLIDNLYDIHPNFIDNDALGFSARVSKFTSMRTGEDVAFKVLRPNHLKDAGVWEQFSVEAKLLNLLKEQQAIVKLLDCGFLADSSQACPTKGEIVSLENDIDEFSAKLDEFRKKQWRPYLSLELLPAKNSLLMLVRGSNGDGSRPFRLPSEEGVNLAMQFLEFLIVMHNNDAVYVDHKPEHVYWDGFQLRIIDLNVSRFLKSNESVLSKQKDKHDDLKNLVKGVFYTVFTGRDFRYQGQNRAPSAAPSDPKAVPDKFTQYDRLDFGMQETLLPQLTDAINSVLGPDVVMSSDNLLDKFKQCAALLGWENVGYPSSNAAIRTRSEVLKGLAALREAQYKIQEARNHFLEASLHSSDDKESSRLYLETSIFYQNRVLS